MAFPERVSDNDLYLEPESDETPRDNLVILPKVEVKKASPGSMEWLEQEYDKNIAKEGIERNIGLMKLRNTVNNYPITIRKRFFITHPDVEFLSRR